jgi:hypothetical protein
MAAVTGELNMSQKLIAEQLYDLQLAPSPRFHRRMSQAPWTSAAIARRYVYSVTSLILIIAAIMLVFTPQGRAWAQEILRFFTRATSDTTLVTHLPQMTTQDPGYVFNKAIAEVEQQVGFDVLEPSWLPVDPDGKQVLFFEGGSIEPQHNIVRIFYRYALGGDEITDGLVLREQRFQVVEDCELCGMVGASAVIEIVQVDDVMGEYVEGVWKADDNGEWNWVPDPYVRTLRWQKGELALEIQYFGLEVWKADLIAIAESMK